MKKIISCILTGIFLVSSIFAGVMDKRFFEVRVDTPVHLSNNVFQLLDVFKSDVYVIDLAEIADSIPNEGAILTSSIAPKLSVRFDIANIYIGVKADFDIYGSFAIDKSIFNFLGYGLAFQEELSVKPSLYGEVFASLGPDIGFKVGKMKFRVNPSLFIPVVVIDSGDSYFTFQNTSEGKFIMDLKGDISVYSQMGLNKNSDLGGIDLTSINTGDGNVSIKSMDAEQWLTRALAVAGFDIAGSVEMESQVSDLSVIGSIRCPIIPGKLYSKTSLKAEKPMETSLSDMLEKNFDFNSITGDFGYSLDSESVVYNVNRPLKINGYAVYNPRRFVILTTGVGMGIRAPFSTLAKVYPEYYVSGTLSLLGGFLKTSLTTEYTNQIFSHTTMLGISLRAVEIDMSMGIESPSFVQSFNVSGLSFNLGIAMGF